MKRRTIKYGVNKIPTDNTYEIKNFIIFFLSKITNTENIPIHTTIKLMHIIAAIPLISNIPNITRTISNIHDNINEINAVISFRLGFILHFLPLLVLTNRTGIIAYISYSYNLKSYFFRNFIIFFYIRNIFT